MRLLRVEGFAVKALTTCVLGLLAAPILFVAIGIATGMLFVSFAPAFFYFVLPVMLACSSFLCWIYLSKPAERKTGFLRLSGEAASWYVVVWFLVFVSGVNLQVGFERFGSMSVLFLAAWLACLPLVLLRRTALERRLARIPPGLALGVSLGVLATSVISAFVYLVTPQRFV